MEKAQGCEKLSCVSQDSLEQHIVWKPFEGMSQLFSVSHCWCCPISDTSEKGAVMLEAKLCTGIT